MRKTTQRFLALVLLAAVLLAHGSMALASASPSGKDAQRGEDRSGEGDRAGKPLPSADGFDFRDVFVATVIDSTDCTIIIAHARNSSSTGQNLVYGIAKIDKTTGTAEDIAGQNWQKPDASGQVRFRDISDPEILLTSMESGGFASKTPAQRFNQDGVGIPYVLPTPNVYNALQPVELTNVKRESSSITILSSSTGQEYALFDSFEGKLVTDWERGRGGALTLSVDPALIRVVDAVTRIWKPDETVIVPVTPPLGPEGDVALTQVGFSLRTAMAVLIIQVTPGLSYAIAKEDGRILNLQERVKWGITAETEDELNVMADSTNFYFAPEEGTQIRFRVPAGGSYYVVSRFPDGTTSKPDHPYQTKAVDGNSSILGPYHDPQGREYVLVRISPASLYSQYAARNKSTGETTAYYYTTKEDTVRFPAYIPESELEIIARPIPLTGTNDAIPSPNQASPAQKIYPPVLSGTLEGAGRTSGGQTILVRPWSPEGTPFNKEDDVVTDALNAPLLQGLDPSRFIGALLASITVENRPDPLTLIVFLDENRSPNPALYYDGKNWSLASLTGGDYLMDFDLEGQEGTVILFETDAKAA